MLENEVDVEVCCMYIFSIQSEKHNNFSSVLSEVKTPFVDLKKCKEKNPVFCLLSKIEYEKMTIYALSNKI